MYIIEKVVSRKEWGNYKVNSRHYVEIQCEYVVVIQLNKMQHPIYTGYTESKVNDRSTIFTHMVIIPWIDEETSLGNTSQQIFIKFLLWLKVSI